MYEYAWPDYFFLKVPRFLASTAISRQTLQSFVLIIIRNFIDIAFLSSLLFLIFNLTHLLDAIDLKPEE